MTILQQRLAFIRLTACALTIIHASRTLLIPVRHLGEPECSTIYV